MTRESQEKFNKCDYLVLPFANRLVDIRLKCQKNSELKSRSITTSERSLLSVRIGRTVILRDLKKFTVKFEIGGCLFVLFCFENNFGK